jgi:hypothetical protein
MRLINTTTVELRCFDDPSKIPAYAILSHTWEEDEVSLQEMTSGEGRHKKGFEKILGTCRLALAHGHEWAWVDTCCIDKTSSAELSEAINSMFKWYKDSKVCYVYLSDLPHNESITDRLSECRWVTRGWTLQELIAPRHVEFYDARWQPRGTKQALADCIENIAMIPVMVLNGIDNIDSHSVASRMRWASRRQTTRPEDTAYCLLGIFDVHMPLIYGEGVKAFRRLQEEIMKTTGDLSIFAWGDPLENPREDPEGSHPLARSPTEFRTPVIFSSHVRMATSFNGITISADDDAIGIFLFQQNPSAPREYVIRLGSQPPYMTNRVFLHIIRDGPGSFFRVGLF